VIESNCAQRPNPAINDNEIETKGSRSPAANGCES
jgi:hypothetical protein